MFFLINPKAPDYPDIIETLRQQGHYVASHSYSHARLTELSDEELENEILRGSNCNALRPRTVLGMLGYTRQRRG